MTDKLWCQMCGKTADGSMSLLPRPTCPSCGAVLVEAPTQDYWRERAERAEKELAIMKKELGRPTYDEWKERK